MSLKDWMPPESREPFFGLDRGKSQLSNGMWLVADINVSDITYRSWWERLTGSPLKLMVKYAYTPRAYVIDDTIIVSYDTYLKIKADPAFLEKVNKAFNQS